MSVPHIGSEGFMYRPDLEQAPAETIRSHQLERLNRLLAEVLPRNAFYHARLGPLTLPLSWERFDQLPFTTKADLVGDQAEAPPFGTNLTYPPDRYVEYHQTSGTTGEPLVVVDTQESWRWWSECWQYVYHGAGVTARNRIFFAFSFGPFIGFWTAYAAAQELGALCIPGGGLDSRGRLEMIRRSGADVLVCTPTYALRLAEVARAAGMIARDFGIRVTIHAGEPGASIPEVRACIEDAWGASCHDHPGATEIGAYGYSCSAQQGVHVNEAEFIAEVLDLETHLPVQQGEIGELVVTGLGRAAWPAIRYRTGDLARLGGRRCACGRSFLMLPDGLIGRADDLIILRGVNVYPSAIEAIVRTFPVDEFRLVRSRNGAMEELTVEVEADAKTADSLAEAFRSRLGVRVPTRIVPGGSLPRFELKARRVIDLR